MLNVKGLTSLDVFTNSRKNKILNKYWLKVVMTHIDGFSIQGQIYYMVSIYFQNLKKIYTRNMKKQQW